MPLHVLRRGLDIPIKGRATGEPVEIPLPATVAYTPTELRGVTPRLDAREGDEVHAGAPLFHDKGRPELRLLSPVHGRVAEVRRGRRRVITHVVVERTGDRAVSFEQWAPSRLDGIGRDAARAGLLGGGLWPTLRTRPLDQIADPGTVPQSILIGGLETGPLQPGVDALLSAADAEAMQAGVHVLKALTDGPVYLGVADGRTHGALAGLKGVEVHTFKGPHPAGDPGVQVNHVDPPRGTNVVWTVRAWDVALIGRLFLEGRFPAERVYAAVGVGVARPRLVKTVVGAPLRDIAGDTLDASCRWIRGSVLTGDQAQPDEWASFYRRAVHVLPDAVERELFGWTSPQLGLFSFHRAFLSGFFRPTRDFDIRPRLFGGARAMVPIAAYNKVVATPDIEVPFLFKSIIAGDLEESIQLGLLDITAEEAALITYICPAKIEYDVLLRQGLQQYQQEM